MPIRGGTRGDGRSRVSVVVPFYNVEAYLGDCLDSIARQDGVRVEAILVDDGSSDGSADVARRYVAANRDWQLVRTSNRGLGAARNLGASLATGDYLAFADADDNVPDGAYAEMSAAIDQTGSDFLTGAVVRDFPDGEAQPPLMSRLHAQRRFGITIEDYPEMLADVFAWNKLFRRRFWRSRRLVFPEGVRYEDQPATTRAYLEAGAFDVWERPTYRWRIRPDGSSITQNRTAVDLRDRITTKAMTGDLVRRHGSAALVRACYLRVLPNDLPVYFRRLRDCDTEYWALLRELVGLWRGEPPLEQSSLRAPWRVVGWLVEHDRRAEADQVLSFFEQSGGSVPFELRGDVPVALLPFLDDSDVGIPLSCFVLRGVPQDAITAARSAGGRGIAADLSRLARAGVLPASSAAAR